MGNQSRCRMTNDDALLHFQVADAELWDELLGEFGLPYACTNAGLALRQIYLR